MCRQATITFVGKIVEIRKGGKAIVVKVARFFPWNKQITISIDHSLRRNLFDREARFTCRAKENGGMEMLRLEAI